MWYVFVAKFFLPVCDFLFLVLGKLCSDVSNPLVVVCALAGVRPRVICRFCFSFCDDLLDEGNGFVGE